MKDRRVKEESKKNNEDALNTLAHGIFIWSLSANLGPFSGDGIVLEDKGVFEQEIRQRQGLDLQIVARLGKDFDQLLPLGERRVFLVAEALLEDQLLYLFVVLIPVEDVIGCAIQDHLQRGYRPRAPLVLRPLHFALELEDFVIPLPRFPPFGPL